MRLWLGSQLAMVALCALACSAASGGIEPTGSGGGGGFGSSGGFGGSAAGTGFSGGGGLAMGQSGAGNGAGGGCVGVSDAAEKIVGGKADIIFVLDNSGSMTEEAIAVQVNMNTFSQRIGASGIDAHVVVISAGPPQGQAMLCDLLDFACWANIGSSFGDSNGVCIDPPLGAQGACPNGDDTNLATGYMHWREEVGSHDALEKIQSTFPGWQTMLRPDAAKNFVVVTDDEASPPPTAAEFTTWVNSQPLFQSALWRFSGVFCLSETDNCAGAGNTYASLVSQTGGVHGDLAQFSTGQVDQQFATVFESLAQVVVADAVPVACEWLIPAPPDGEALDPGKVNVLATHGDGSTTELFGVPVADCPAASEFLGWHYDDPANPSRVIACPETCPVLQNDNAVRIDVQFGCQSKDPPIR